MSKLLAKAQRAVETGQFAPALDAIAECEQTGPLALQHYKVRGYAQLGLSDWAGATETFRTATSRWHENHELWAYFGIALQNLAGAKSASEAVSAFEQSLRLNPNNGVAAANLANLYRKLGRFEEAEKLALTGLKYHPDKIWAANILALVIGELGDFKKARDLYYQALQIAPDSANVTYNLANLEANLENFEAAWPLFKRVQELNPHPRMRIGESIARLLAGDYKKGWAIHEARREGKNGGMLIPNPPGKPYAGEPVMGKKIALVAEQGFGDALQISRFGPELVKAGAEISWVVPKPLVRLFAASFPGTFHAVGEAVPQADYHIPIGSLPYYLECGNAPELWPKPPYLTAPDGPKLPETGREGPKVGLIWAGAAQNERDRHRSMPLSALAPLFRDVKAQYYAPFLHEKLNEIKREPIVRLDHLIRDFGDTAALMMQMDYIVAVETSAAHLAGALGKKILIPINCQPDWRWGFRGEDSAWYPNAILLRQDSPGDWGSAIKKVVEKMQSFQRPI